MADLSTFEQYYKLAEMLIEKASKEQLAECSRSLGLNLAHYRARYGELPLDEMPIAKQVMSSRSFGQRVESLQELREAISNHAANAAQRLRKQRVFANAVSVFIQNSPFDEVGFYGRTETVVLPASTECSLQITNEGVIGNEDL